MSNHVTRFARRRASCAVFLLLVLLPGTLLAASGRDLTYGYTWRDSNDGATLEEAVFDGTVLSTNPGDNSTPQGPIDLGFPDDFPFYGATYPSIWISDNGFISFAAPANSYPTPAASMPNNALPNGGVLATFWTNLIASDVIQGDTITYGHIASINAFRVAFVGRDLSQAGQPVWYDVFLYSDGRIKFQYTSPATILGNATIGIENAAGNDGIQIAAGGVAQPGVALVPNYVIEFQPPLVLPTQCASIPDRGCTTFNGALPGPLGAGNVLYYGCSTTRNEGRERVQSFTLADASAVTITLTSARPLRAYLLDACDERACLRGPFTTLSIPLGPGTYYVAVDAPLQADEGNYTLDVACTPLGTPALACGGSTAGTTVGGSNFWSAYPCAGTTDLSGPERIHRIDIAAATNLTATLSGMSGNFDLAIVPITAGEILASNCIAWGDTTAVAWNIQPGSYLIVVDGVAGASGTYNLATQCGIRMDCSTLEGTLDFAAGRVQTAVGDTTGGTDTVSTYACDPAVVHDGPEHVWEINLPSDGQIAVYQVEADPGLNYRILSACNEGACEGVTGSPACATRLAAGTYYLVVDGTGGAAGAYDLMIVYEETFNRWDVCELPQDPTTVADTSSAFWHFSDEAFCITNPASHNYPDGCTWAMYAVVRCGTEFHLPMYDVEGGHIRVFDVFRGEYVELTAVSPAGYFAVGDDIRWQDADCEFGSDPRWTEVTVDVSFARPEGLCGVFRIEFPVDHSGFVWELYANCAGDRNPLFQIHDSLCAALADYDPLPNVSLSAASAVATCPDITVTYDIRNDGCSPARNVPVTLRDGGVNVYVDTVPVVNSGETLTRVFSTSFPSTPTTVVELVADLPGVVLECSESSGVACEVNAGNDVQPLPGCLGACQILAAATVSPPQACSGTPITIDATTSSSSLCPGGILEYQLRGPTGTVPWQASPIFGGLLPTATGDYDVDVRCADAALRDTCVDSVRVRAQIDRVPDFDPATVTAQDIASCNVGIRLTWRPATFYGPLGTGFYNIYRSEISCADAVTRAALEVGLSTTNYTDVNTVAGTTYYYVVEAEDSNGPSPCVPRGPRNGGAVTRVDAPGGSCTGILEFVGARPDLLPRVGGTLRAGGSLPGGIVRYGETFVEFDWSSDRAPDLIAGEHFHVLRSESPDTGFSLLSVEPPRTVTGYYIDLQADDTVGNGGTHVWHYLVYSADDCENDNQSVPGA